MKGNNLKVLRLLFALLIALFVLAVPALGECAEVVSADMVEIEYGGKLITVDMADVILMSDGRGGQTLKLYEPEKYAEQLQSAPTSGSTPKQPPVLEADLFQDAGSVRAASDAQEITEREYEEEQRARRWADVVEDLTLRQIDEKALELVKEYGEAKGAVPPMTGDAGTLVLSYSSYVPKIVCRPMYVTDVILQPGETVTGVHPGDPVRWTFVPSRSGTGGAEQIHVMIKPLMADISTNLVINTDKRTYQLDLVSSATNHVPSVSFSYPADALGNWKTFIEEKKAGMKQSAELAAGYSVSPEDLHMDYEVRGKDSLRWKPVRVWDDGVKTYIQFKKGSMKKSVEAPVLVVFERKKEVLVNYRVAEDMYVADKVFDIGALIVGTGSEQSRVVIKRLKGK